MYRAALTGKHNTLVRRAHQMLNAALARGHWPPNQNHALARSLYTLLPGRPRPWHGQFSASLWSAGIRPPSPGRPRRRRRPAGRRQLRVPYQWPRAERYSYLRRRPAPDFPCQQSRPAFEKTCATTDKNVKSCFFGFWKKREKRTFSFRGHLITPVFNTQLPKLSTGKSPTSNILLCNNVSEQP